MNLLRAIGLAVSALLSLLLMRWFASASRTARFNSEHADDHFTAVKFDDDAAHFQKRAEEIKERAEAKLQKTRELGHAPLVVWADRINRL